MPGHLVCCLPVTTAPLLLGPLRTLQLGENRRTPERPVQVFNTEGEQQVATYARPQGACVQQRSEHTESLTCGRLRRATSVGRSPPCVRSNVPQARELGLQVVLIID